VSTRAQLLKVSLLSCRRALQLCDTDRLHPWGIARQLRAEEHDKRYEYLKLVES
jgi:hypothetical protein